tara:strand:- start:794 stop:1297 length:504 start_codon:yes stop_codon:yes gene_type:complete
MWSSNGSISERLRALKIQDDLLIKNDPMMAAQGMQPPMNTPGPNGADLPMTADQDFSGVGQSINDLVLWFDEADTRIGNVNKALSQQGVSGVLPAKLAKLETELHSISGALLALKYTVMGLHDIHGPVTLNEPANSMTPMGNERLGAGMGSVSLSPQGNASMMGGGF